MDKFGDIFGNFENSFVKQEATVAGTQAADDDVVGLSQVGVLADADDNHGPTEQAAYLLHISTSTSRNKN